MGQCWRRVDSLRSLRLVLQTYLARFDGARVTTLAQEVLVGIWGGWEAVDSA